MRTHRLLLPILFLTPILANDRRPEEPPPVRAFARLNGTWVGSFVGHDNHGKELYRIRVKQVYRILNRTTQKVEIEDVMPDGSKVTGIGENVASRGPDGSLVLRCAVVKSNGDRVELEGRIIRGPDGDEQLLWYTDKPGRKEVFREVIRKERNETVYSINGMGLYGGSLILMNGRYRKQ